MPSINLQIGPLGPLVHVFVGVSVHRENALKAERREVPQATHGLFLIDTGASHTSVDPALLEPLRMQPSGSVAIHTPSTNGTPVNCSQYDISLAIGAPNGVPFGVAALPVTEAPLAAQGIAGLLGRDILSFCVLIYNGVTGHYTLCY